MKLYSLLIMDENGLKGKDEKNLKVRYALLRQLPGRITFSNLPGQFFRVPFRILTITLSQQML